LLHSEDVQHFGCAAESDGLLLLPHGKRSQKNGNEAILTPRHTIYGMTSDLQQKLAVAALVQEGAFWRTLNGQSAKHKGTRGEPEVLRSVFPVQPYKLHCFGLTELPFRNY